MDKVRRYYPFIPMIGGRVIAPFQWREQRFERNDWVLFDIYGTNHDARIWANPGVFRPECFEKQSFGPYDLVSHGGGNRSMTHRYPEEGITIEQMKAVLRIMLHEMSYEIPPQDLEIKLSRIPALPLRRFILSNIQLHTPSRF